MLPCCGVKNRAHRGRRQKECCCGAHFDKWLQAKVLVTPDNRQCGYIEYLPGEYAWRGVKARGYLFIHCIWTFYKGYQHKGLAGAMVEACVEDAKKAGLRGVAVVARNRPWLAGSALFLKSGFVVVETAPPDYQLLVRKLKAPAANPSFAGGWDRNLAKYSDGLTIIRSAQCPHSWKFAAENRGNVGRGIWSEAEDGENQVPGGRTGRAYTLRGVRRYLQRPPAG